MSPEPGSWQHDLVELLEALSRHEVPHLIAGGYAVAHAGYLRATKDVDIFVPRISGFSASIRSFETSEPWVAIPISPTLRP